MRTSNPREAAQLRIITRFCLVHGAFDGSAHLGRLPTAKDGHPLADFRSPFDFQPPHMSSTFPSGLLAAVTDAGVHLHDVIGGVALAVFLVIGLIFHKRGQQAAADGPHSLSETPVDRKFSRLQIWILYWLAVAAIVAFFFVWPRAESRIAPPSMEENAKSQKLG